MGVKGQRFGRWVLDRKLGDGLAGEVWKAREEGNPAAPPAALKLFYEPNCIAIARESPPPETAPEHPNICRILDADFQSNPPFIVSELVEGVGLRALLEHHRYMPLLAAVPCVIQVVRGLAALHASGIPHGGIKPQNVLLDEHGRAKLADLMPDAYRQELGRRVLEKRVSVLKPERAQPVIEYMAPEQRRVLGAPRPGTAAAAAAALSASGAAYDPFAADMYSFGIMTFELLTGKKPSPGIDFTFPSQLDKRIPKILDEIVMRCLERAPRARLLSAAGLEQQLIEGLDRAGFRLDLFRAPAEWVRSTPWKPVGAPEGEETQKFVAIFKKLTEAS